MLITTNNNCESLYTDKIKNLKIKETIKFKKFITFPQEKNKKININEKNKSNFIKKKKEKLSFNDSIIKLEKSEISTEAAMRIANKLILIYQEIMNLQL
ncbi:flagellar hook-basal body complex protein FliE [Buchnera aphidicola (Mindarus keteleerifoliae)]|uniref:flagellar hook-basal body complex protein FliE n=1 Tax=Buchnera aphidicola TaxID=9 RepID=UPI0031B72575